MSVALSKHLPLLSTAPAGIQKLRGLILELAVRGKLVPQDPSDEPASELLKRIAKERAQLEAEGACRKSKAMPLIGMDEQPYSLPAGWMWVRLSEIGHDWGQQTPDADFTYVDVSAIDNARGIIDSPSVVAPAGAPSRARKIVRRGTVIYSTVRPYLLNIAVIDRDLTPAPIASTAFAVIHPLAGLSSQYIFWYLRSPVFVRYVESVQTGIAYPAINDGQFFSGVFPLPPFAEQHRIVAKVDELMALCDRLEAEQTDAESAHTKLVDTLLGTLIQSTDAADLAANWLRLADHFHTLFTTESSLDSLKQTMLQLAVMGKLVPQDPNDEPASRLLKRIAQERARLEAEGVCKKSKPVLPVEDHERQHSIPPHWEYVRLQDLCSTITDGTHQTPKYTDSGRPFLSAQNVKPFRFMPENFRFVSEEDYQGYIKSTKPEFDDVLLTRVGAMIGEAAVIDKELDFAIYVSLALLKPIRPFVSSEYVVVWLNSPFGTHASIRDTLGRGVSAGNLNLGMIRAFAIPLPPINEQHRIVAKVNELMGLCDRLKADLAESRRRQERLAATLIESALKAA